MSLPVNIFLILFDHLICFLPKIALLYKGRETTSAYESLDWFVLQFLVFNVRVIKCIRLKWRTLLLWSHTNSTSFLCICRRHLRYTTYTMASLTSIYLMFVCLLLATFSLVVYCNEGDNSQTKESNKNSEEVSEEQLTYAKGSMCGYCDYCKVCVSFSPSLYFSLRSVTIKLHV